MSEYTMDGRSMDLEQANKAKLRAIFPECFSEGELEIDKLLALCGEYISDDYEKYEFKWKGKRDCLRLAQKRSSGTLRPCPEESVNFDATQNLYIEGDNLEVLKLLQKSYFRKVKMIYIDPPYNTGNDFVYEDDFADPLARYKEVTEQATKSNPETMGRFHTNWLNMIYPRLCLAANLLRDDGVIFISIDDHEVDNLKKVCNEVFGEENFVAQLIWQKKTGASDAKGIAIITEYILVYAKNFACSVQNFAKNTDSYDLNRYRFADEFVAERGPYYTDNLDRGGLAYSDSLNYGIECPDGTITFPNGRTEYVNDGWIWKWSKAKIEWARKNHFIEFRKTDKKASGWAVCYKNYLNVDNENQPIERAAPFKNILDDILICDILNANAAATMKTLLGTNNYFNYAKPVELLEKLIKLIRWEEGDLILDFFSGSATTAHAVMQLNAEDGGNRRFIMVQLPEQCDAKTEAFKAGYANICEIGKERIRRAGKNLLAESERSLLDADRPPLDVGFKTFKLDSSNIQKWNDIPVEEDVDALLARMVEQISGLKPDRDDLDFVYEIILKIGCELTVDVAVVDVDGLPVYSVDGGKALVCLCEGFDAERVEKMAALNPKPQKIVVLERAFADDSAMSNAFYLLKNREIELKIV